jgi:hypothetical protein
VKNDDLGGNRLSDDPTAAISALLEQPGPTAALAVLRYAADWSARTVLMAAHDDDTAALECVIALDEALPPISELMGRAPELVKLASAGRSAGELLAAAEAEFARQRAELTAERGRLEAARELRTRLAEVEAERDRLRADIERLERTRLIERELPALRGRLAEVAAAVSAAVSAAESGAESGAASGEEGERVVRGLLTAAGQLRELTEAQRSLLAAGNAQLVSAVKAAADAAGRELARRDELTAELETRQREADQLRIEYQRNLPGLRARQQADQELVGGLAAGGLPAGKAGEAGEAGEAAVARVRTELSELEQRLENVEGLLKPLLQQHAQAYEQARQVRGLTG